MKLLLAFVCLLVLIYWIIALHNPVPMHGFFRVMYGAPRGRSGPSGIILLGFAGLWLAYSSLRDSGEIDADED